MFGIRPGPEVYQHVIQQVLQGCEGVANISDNITVHGRSTEEHNRLERVLERLKEKNLTLNAEKCRFHMTQMVYIEIVLSNKGIGPTEVTQGNRRMPQESGVSSLAVQYTQNQSSQLPYQEAHSKIWL